MSQLAPPLSASDHQIGSPTPLVSLLEYGDFECSFCGEAFPIVERLREKFGDLLLFAFRHFPLAQAHPHAVLAAEAAEAAGVQGKFWEMHHMLYQNQRALTAKDLLGYAEVLGLDVPRFSLALQHDDQISKVKADFRSGVRSGVNGTPTFFIDGQRFDRGNTLEALTSGLQIAIDANRRRPKASGR